MGLFNRYKGIGEYKLLEVINEKKTPIDIHSALYRVLFEDENVQYFLYGVKRWEDTNYYLLRKDKNNKGRIVFLGSVIEPVCYCNGKIFWAFPYAISMHNHNMTMIDGITGEQQEIDFLGQEEVLGFDVKQCHDKIKTLSSNQNDIILRVLRRKTNDPTNMTNPLNDDLFYNIVVNYQNGAFTREPVTTNSIVNRGPWPKPNVILPPGPYTAADMEILYNQYGKEAVIDALLYKEIYE